MRKTLARIAVATVMLAGIYSQSAQAAGTSAGTALSSTASISASGISAVTSAATTTVTAVYGLDAASLDETSAADASIAAGATGTYVFAIMNNANTSDTVGVNLGAMTFGTGAGTTANWEARVDDAAAYAAPLTWQNSGAATANQAGDQASAAIAIGPGAYATFALQITVAADATNGATMDVQFKFVIDTATASTYVGFNTNTYGGAASVLRTVGGGGLGASYIRTTVNAAILTLSKSASITKPAGYGGAAGTPVPGAKISYTLTYGNTGTAAATSVVIVDPKPSNTTYSAGSIQLNAVAKTDALDGDTCDYNVSNANAVTCTVASLGNGVVGQTLTYDVTID